MSYKTFLPAAAMAAFLLSGCAGNHAPSRFESDFDDSDKPWAEVAHQLPPAPRAEDLVAFDVSGNSSLKFAIDARSLSVGPDLVVRYTLVATSPSGVKNVSYEGIRCETFEKKVYAFAQGDGSWAKSRQAHWERIARNLANRQHAVLAQDFFCENTFVSGGPEQMLGRIRRGDSLKHGGYGA